MANTLLDELCSPRNIIIPFWDLVQYRFLYSLAFFSKIDFQCQPSDAEGRIWRRKFMFLGEKWNTENLSNMVVSHEWIPEGWQVIAPDGILENKFLTFTIFSYSALCLFHGVGVSYWMLLPDVPNIDVPGKVNF